MQPQKTHHMAKKTKDTYEYSLMEDLQTAIEIELTTIPLYLYTYYSINRAPKGSTDQETAELTLQANKAAATIMSVVIEEMLHMSLASNIKRSLGGFPVLAGDFLIKKLKFPSNLPHHAKGFKANLSKYTKAQLSTFMKVELPTPPNASPKDADWSTIGQFYDSIIERVKKMKKSDFGYKEYQLGPGNDYYSPNSANSTYMSNYGSGKSKQVRMNAEDSGGLHLITSPASAVKAMKEICHQGEGFADKGKKNHKYDDPSHQEESHYYRFKELYEIYSEDTAAKFVLNVPDNPKTKDYPAMVQPLSNLTNAVYTYLFLMMELCYQHPVPAQSSIFNFGIHKAMIFILSSLCSFMTTFELKGDQENKVVLAPTFEGWKFDEHVSPKEQLIMLWKTIPKEFKPDTAILDRIKNLPDVEMKKGELVQF